MPSVAMCVCVCSAIWGRGTQAEMKADNDEGLECQTTSGLEPPEKTHKKTASLPLCNCAQSALEICR